MFDFIEKWDTTLKNIQQDLEFSIKGEVKSWVIHLQTYLEKLLKIYYYNQNSKMEKLTLGDLLRDQIFVDSIIRGTGFADIGWIRNVNNIANEIKHNANYYDFTEKEINDWIQKAHKLSICIYNVTHNDKIEEQYDQKYVSQLIRERDESEESLIAYADTLISKRSKKIESLQNQLDELHLVLQRKESEFVNNNKEKIKLRHRNEHYQKEIFYYDKAVNEIFGSKHGKLGTSDEYLDRTRNDAKDLYDRLTGKYGNVLRKASCTEFIIPKLASIERGFDSLICFLDLDSKRQESLIEHITENSQTYLDIYENYNEKANPDSISIELEELEGLQVSIHVLKKYLKKQLDEQREMNQKKHILAVAGGLYVDSTDNEYYVSDGEYDDNYPDEDDEYDDYYSDGDDEYDDEYETADSQSRYEEIDDKRDN